MKRPYNCDFTDFPKSFSKFGYAKCNIVDIKTFNDIVTKSVLNTVEN